MPQSAEMLAVHLELNSPEKGLTVVEKELPWKRHGSDCQTPTYKYEKAHDFHAKFSDESMPSVLSDKPPISDAMEMSDRSLEMSNRSDEVWITVNSPEEVNEIANTGDF